VSCVFANAYANSIPALPDDILERLIELSEFFKNLYSTVLRVDKLQEMQCNIRIILCKLETVFPPGFFNVMEHLLYTWQMKHT